MGQEIKELRVGRGPPLELRVLNDPGPVSIRKILGPGLILAALGVGMGETFMWPRLVIVFGPEVRWLATVGLVIQIFVTMEIARWTYFSGESIFTAGKRIHPIVMWYFYIVAILVYIWPGHVVTGSGALGMLLKVDWVMIAVISLCVIAAILILSPYQVYKTVKFLLLIAISMMIAVSFGVAVLVGKPEHWGQALYGTVAFGYWTDMMSTKTWLPLLVGALAFMGPSGMQQMWYTLWAREEGAGMSGYMPKITGLIFGKEDKWRDSGFYFDVNLDEEMDKWKRWRKLNIYDALISFGLITYFTTLFFTVLSMRAAELSPAALSAIRAGATLRAIDAIASAFTYISPVLYPLWFIVMFLVGWKMSFGIFDAFARGQADMTFQLFKGAQKLGMRKWYYIWVATVTIIGIITTVSGAARGPAFMLDLLAFLSPLIMGSYCLLLLYVNNKMLPKRCRMSWLSTIVIAGGAAFYLVSLFYCTFVVGAIPTG
ncbi:MAG: Nramp family divalent metal transporter [Candidatus Methanomethyliaceae archaeon]|nr:Nramp family divalent metal transporter [Candidatus Methanomethyliaceae archaeon]